MRVLIAAFVLLIATGKAPCSDSGMMIGSIDIAGDLPENDPRAFIEDDFRGLTASESSFKRIANILVDFYGERGYPFAQACIDDLKLADSNTIELTIRLSVGPLSHFDTCNIEGIDRRTAAYLSRISDIHTGSPFSNRAIETSKRVFRSHRFLAVDDSVELIFRDDFSICTPVFKLRRLPTNLVEGSLGYQPAYGSQSAFVRGFARLEFENLLGRGRRFSIRYNKKDPLSHEVALGFYQPFVFYQPISTSLDLEQLKLDSLYQKISLSSEIEYGEGRNVSVRVSGGWSRYAPQGAVFRGVYHSRRWWWGVGSTVSLSSAVVLQTFDLNISYGVKQRYRFANYKPENARTTDTRLEGSYESTALLTSSFRFSAIISSAAIVSDESVIPIPDLYRLGGLRSLRGYREDQFFCERYALFRIQPEALFAHGASFHLFSDGAWFLQQSGETLFRSGMGGGFEFSLPNGRLLTDVAWGKGDGLGDGKLYLILESRF